MPGFKTDEFNQADLKQRQETIPVPDLKHWFEEGQEPVWTVRMLDGYEYEMVKEAVNKNRDMLAIAEAIIAGGNEDLGEALKERIGVGDAVPDKAAERIETLVLGSVDPVISNETAVKMCVHFPVILTELSTKIWMLSGQGAELGKSQDSGEIQK